MKPVNRSPITSPSLLLRIRDPQDVDSWQTFQEIYAPIMHSYCRKKGVQSSDADDIVQEVLAVVARAIKTFEYAPEKGRFRAWLGTVTANELKSYVAKRGNRQAAELTSGMFNELSVDDPDSEWVWIFSNHIFQTACARVQTIFEAKTWQSFEATWILQRSAVQVAASLGIPVHSVYVNKSRVLKRLEEEVKLLAHDFPLINPAATTG